MSVPVIGVAGPPGSGKSTLARGLGAALGGPVLAYDDYETMTREPPEVVAKWLARGADIAAIGLPGLAADLARLRRGEAVAPRSGAPARRPGAAVVLDTLVGRAHPDTAGAAIDLLIWIETPLDVALARKLRRVIGEGAHDPRGCLAWLDGYLGHYPGFVRAAYGLQRERVAAGAEIVLDGLRPARDLLAAALAAIAARRPPPGDPQPRPPRPPEDR